MIAPDAATAGGSSPRLVCGQSMSGIDESVSRVTVVLKYTFHESSAFRQVACAIGGMALVRVACLKIHW